MSKNTVILPLCRSEFLQDVTIALGRWRKGFKYQMAEFECEVREDKDGGESFECLTIHCHEHDGSILSLHLWDDQTALVQTCGATTRGRKRSKLAFYPDISNFTPEGIFAALKQSISNGTSPDLLPQIWEHNGEIFR
ncbi:MAG TPA: hypothetical protein PLB55_13895 [Prosthecobacter sp.]|nr:hypothetical protein [Prosthecobacter sp.]